MVNSVVSDPTDFYCMDIETFFQMTFSFIFMFFRKKVMWAWNDKGE